MTCSRESAPKSGRARLRLRLECACYVHQTAPTCDDYLSKHADSIYTVHPQLPRRRTSIHLEAARVALSHPPPQMSLDPPTYLASLQSNIRQRPIPWDGAVRAGTITEDHLARIRAVDKAKKPEARKDIVEGDLDGYRSLFVGEPGKSSVLESAGKQANVVQFVLVLLADLLPSTSCATVPYQAAFLATNSSALRIVCSEIDCGALIFISRGQDRT